MPRATMPRISFFTTRRGFRSSPAGGTNAEGGNDALCVPVMMTSTHFSCTRLGVARNSHISEHCTQEDVVPAQRNAIRQTVVSRQAFFVFFVRRLPDRAQALAPRRRATTDSSGPCPGLARAMAG